MSGQISQETAADLLEACRRVARVAVGAFLPGRVYLSIEERDMILAALAKAARDRNPSNAEDS